MIFRSKKVILLIILVLISVVVIIAATIQSGANKNSSKPSSVAPFTIKGINNSQFGFSLNTQTQITNTIDTYLKNDKINSTNIQGEARAGSFTKETTDYGTSTSILIDIPAVKRTYKAASSNDNDGYSGLYVTCPEPAELKYGEFDCKDETDE